MSDVKKINTRIRLCSGWPSQYLILILDEALSGLEISLNHLLNKGIEVNFSLPPKKALSLCWIS